MTKKSPAKVRRLFWDIETSPNVVLAFRAGYDVVINHDAIIAERKIICIGFKWEGEKKITVLRWDKNQCDKAMLREFLSIANEADELIHHFGDRFDLPWFRTRCLLHGFEPLPPYKTIDTKMWASKYYYFNSNKLDYISEVLGHGRKLKTDFGLWKAIVMDKCEKSLNYMCKYCGIDVDRLEKVYHDLKFCVKPKSHAGVMAGLDKWTCPRDGSTNVHLSKKRVSSAGTKTYQMQCQDCGGYYQINASAFAEYQDFLKEEHKK
jgi:predicted PolB exonuclease-like 3'-5' exonuclease